MENLQLFLLCIISCYDDSTLSSYQEMCSFIWRTFKVWNKLKSLLTCCVCPSFVLNASLILKMSKWSRLKIVSNDWKQMALTQHAASGLGSVSACKSECGVLLTAAEDRQLLHTSQCLNQLLYMTLHDHWNRHVYVMSLLSFDAHLCFVCAGRRVLRNVESVRKRSTAMQSVR